jgi:hypothetical protein
MSIPFFAPAAQYRQKNINSITVSNEYSGEFPTVPLVPATSAGKFVHRRHGVPASIADLLASLAGLGLEEPRQ